MKPLKFISMLAVTTSMSLVGCQQQAEEVVKEEVTKETAKPTSTVPADAPTYKVYTIDSFEPYCFRDEFGNATGFDIDVMNAIAEKMAFHTSYITAPWEKVLPSLSNDKTDIVASAVIINEERKEKYSFSNSYITTHFAMAVTDTYKDSTFQEIIANKDVNYSILSETAAEKILTHDLKISKDQIANVKTQFLAIEKILTGSADATFEDETVLHYYGKNYKNLYIKPYEATTIELGFAVKKDNVELKNKIDEGLKMIKADGTFDMIYTKWFGAKL